MGRLVVAGVLLALLAPNAWADSPEVLLDEVEQALIDMNVIKEEDYESFFHLSDNSSIKQTDEILLK